MSVLDFSTVKYVKITFELTIYKTLHDGGRVLCMNTALSVTMPEFFRKARKTYKSTKMHTTKCGFILFQGYDQQGPPVSTEIYAQQPAQQQQGYNW